VVTGPLLSTVWAFLSLPLLKPSMALSRPALGSAAPPRAGYTSKHTTRHNTTRHTISRAAWCANEGLEREERRRTPAEGGGGGGGPPAGGGGGAPPAAGGGGGAGAAGAGGGGGGAVTPPMAAVVVVSALQQRDRGRGPCRGKDQSKGGRRRTGTAAATRLGCAQLHFEVHHLSVDESRGSV
jgi:hypothetical protein